MAITRLVVFLLMVSLAPGCATGLGRRGEKSCGCHAKADPTPATNVGVGKRNGFVDGLGWVVGVPSKILIWNGKVNNHRVSEETTDAVVNYLDANDLDDVYVRVNQYRPGQEWRRLRENKSVGAGWRYTLGVLNLAGYTLLPGRIFGGDRYNPYTNSVYLYSDVPALALEAAAYAKDVHSRRRPGCYAAINELPFLTLWHETIATREAIAYLDQTGGPDAAADGQRILHPYYGMRVGATTSSVIGGWPLLTIGGAVVGQVTGRVAAYKTRSTLLEDPIIDTAPEIEASPTPALTDEQQLHAEGPAEPSILQFDQPHVFAALNR